MTTTARFLIQRRKELKQIFTEKNLVKVWRTIVRKQLRSLELLDLYDYYDFNYNIEQKAKQIRKAILSGQYKVSPPLIYRMEKKYGICRHLMLPTPTDALILQTIVENLAPALLKSSPTKQAYYSRDKHSLKLPHEIKIANDYSWLARWKKFQKDILKFAKDYPYLVVTDLTNYYDNIGLRELRHVISSRVKTHETVLDLLFYIVEELSWHPDYLPTSLKGLPTINLEAFRLLAHVLLFEIDEVLKERTQNSFVRWMDDINFGVDDFNNACLILGDLNEVLKSRGLALNLGKTHIYSSEEVKEHFLVNFNLFLDKILKETDLCDSQALQNASAQLQEKFKIHCSNTQLQNWIKVTKRFFTVAGKLKSLEFLPIAEDFFLEYPAIRGNICYYFKLLGFSKKTGKSILKILQKASFYDDISLYFIVKLLTDWHIPYNKLGKSFVKHILKLLKKDEFTKFQFYSYLWFAAKYERPNKILGCIQTQKKLWKQDAFLARQVMSITPRVLPFKEDVVASLLEEQISFGPRDAAFVAQNINELAKLKKLPQKLRMYLFPNQKPQFYPLSKFLILYAALLSENTRQTILSKVYDYIYDDWYLYWINEYFDS